MKYNDASTESGWNLDNSYSRLPEYFFSGTAPSPVSSPKLVILNRRLAESLGISAEYLQSEEGISILAGNKIPEGSVPIAEAYAGHQFGYFTMLGDGRAMLIGEQISPSGERYDIQLKGSGRTPYSRGGDGRAVLGPMLREYIISEAMHSLGIPTTRSLAVVTTGETVYRETPQIGAVLTRAASSHLRVGTFQYAAMTKDVSKLRTLAGYTIKRHYPDAVHEGNRYSSLLKQVIIRQASLIAKWQLAGFIHGVMNTDNMTLSGETIDYGPCAFMNEYDPTTVFSSIDRQGRYAYGNQPAMAEWNLARFAETLLPLLSDYQEEAIEMANDALAYFSEQYQSVWLGGMRAKLGIFNEEDGDMSLAENLLSIMHKHHADFTNTFLVLTYEKPAESELFESQEYKDWHKRWQQRLSRQCETKRSSQELMRRSNPALIPRNHRVEEALDAAADGDYSFLHRLLSALENPYEHSPQQEEYSEPPGQSACGYRTFCGT